MAIFIDLTFRREHELTPDLPYPARTYIRAALIEEYLLHERMREKFPLAADASVRCFFMFDVHGAWIATDTWRNNGEDDNTITEERFNEAVRETLSSMRLGGTHDLRVFIVWADYPSSESIYEDEGTVRYRYEDYSLVEA